MNQPDSPEFTEILERVPRWHMLTPGVDKPKEGDEIRVESRREWIPAKDLLWKLNRPYECDVIARRPIPENVRRSMAFHALWQKIDGIQEGPGAYMRWIFG